MEYPKECPKRTALLAKDGAQSCLTISMSKTSSPEYQILSGPVAIRSLTLVHFPYVSTIHTEIEKVVRLLFAIVVQFLERDFLFFQN